MAERRLAHLEGVRGARGRAVIYNGLRHLALARREQVDQQGRRCRPMDRLAVARARQGELALSGVQPRQCAVQTLADRLGRKQAAADRVAQARQIAAEFVQLRDRTAPN